MGAKRISAYARIKGMVRTSLILTFLLGITWLIGFPMALTWNDCTTCNKDVTTALALIFDGLNCSIGIFIFIYSIMLDSKMLESTKIAFQRSLRRLSIWTRKGVTRPIAKVNASLKTSKKKFASNDNSDSRKRTISSSPTLSTTLSLKCRDSDASDEIKIYSISNQNKCRVK